ncbi:MAG TPA: hypothetical protein VFX76_08330 [Roseiflexaceae bacterium]|nr:hypothetical protein [Roseiflexaceae bacterium]
MLRLRAILLLAALVLACLVAPASAAERVDGLPEIRQFSSGRFEYALTVGGEIHAYGNGTFESLARIAYIYGETGDQPSIQYYLAYDGELYSHDEGQSEWTKLEGQAAPIPRPSYDAVALLAQRGTVSRIGDADVAGTPTTQYQIWVNDSGAATAGPLKVDLFVGKDTPYVYKLQITAGDAPDQIGAVYRFYDLDSNIVVPVPPAD